VNHTLSVDGVKIKEVEGWFVESIECTGTGFTIKLSHKQYQYDDPASEATLHMLTKGRYEWKWLE
jgi:hypothetical protein